MDKLNDIMKQLQNALESQVEALEPAPFQPVEDAEWETVSFDGTEKDNSAWLALIKGAHAGENPISCDDSGLGCWGLRVAYLYWC